MLLGLTASVSAVTAAPAWSYNGMTPQHPMGWIHIHAHGVNVDMPVVQQGKSNEDGYYPTHYPTTNWVCDGQMAAISAHHYTHRLPGAAGGPFRYVPNLRRGDVITVKAAADWGGCTVKYRVTGKVRVYCKGDKWGCWPAVPYLRRHPEQYKFDMTTCDGDGSYRYVIYAFKEEATTS